MSAQERTPQETFELYQQTCEDYRDSAIKRTSERNAYNQKLDQRTGELIVCREQKAINQHEAQKNHEELEKRRRKERRLAFGVGAGVGAGVVVVIRVIVRAFTS